MLTLLLVLAATGAPKTVVMDLSASAGVPPEVAKSANLLVPTEVRRYAAGTVISGEEIRSLLGLEHQKQLLGCKESSCLAEVAGALGADEVVDGTLGKLGGTLLIELHRVDVHKAQTRSSVTREVKGDPEEILGALRGAVAELYGRPPPAAELEARPASSARSPWPPVLAGSGLVVAGAGGMLWALSVHSDVTRQQDAAVQPTVSTGTARTASVVFPVSIAAAVAGAGLIAWGALSATSDNPASPASQTEVTLAPSAGGATVSVQGRF